MMTSIWRFMNKYVISSKISVTMRTIDTIEQQNHTGEIIYKYSICFPIDHLWAEGLKQVRDCNSFSSFLIVRKGSLRLSVNYSSIALNPYDLLIVTPRLLVETESASNDFSGYYLAIDEKQYNGMMASDSSYRHLTQIGRAHV